jgi:hypothetical protein
MLLIDDAVCSEFTPEKCGAGPSAPAKGKEGGLGVRNSTSKKRPAETDDSISSYDHTANSSEDPLAEFYAQAISDKDAEVPQQNSYSLA